ncbi:hypothetical protein [Actinosynnema sp. NPDC020468]|uniref:hypothetical protein n=1 Tax=Actinosynnema sp. NPDC020468 TaxID=3154488 RepID=UPI0033C9A732
MDDGKHRKTSPLALRIGAVALGVLVLLGAVQAATSGTVGIGALSVDLKSRPATTSAPVADDPLPAVGTTTAEGTTASAENKVAEGSWKVAKGLLTVEITRVENQAGRLRLYVTAVNAGTSAMDLPVASVSAVDDAKRDYGASLATSRWPVTVKKGGTTTGFLDLDQRPSAASATLTVTFAGIIGQLAPTGGSVTVPDVPIPR